MRLIIVDRGKEFCDVARWQFRSHPEVQVVCGRFEDLPSFDCVVTAGNSFGLMDAGMDLAVVRFFGRHVMERIQKQILDDFLGEQPVGTCARNNGTSPRCSAQLRSPNQTRGKPHHDRSRASAQTSFISSSCPGRHRRLRPFSLLPHLIIGVCVEEVVRLPNASQAPSCASCKVSTAIPVIARD